MKRILVLGGNGFVGKAICRAAVNRGLEVNSLARSPVHNLEPLLRNRVKWIQGDALDMGAYREALQDVDTVIHSIGIIVEPQDKSATYESANRDTLLASLKALNAFHDSVERFAFVSAANFGFLGRFLLARYMSAKQEAEKALIARIDLTRIIARPSFMYGKDRPITIPFALLYNISSFFTAGLLPKARHVDTVAAEILDQLSKAPSKSLSFI
jgi:nucleoside-diphosphate-sugar epimerase